MPEFPTTWIRIDTAAVALNTTTERALVHAKRDRWRSTHETGGFRVYAFEDVKQTAIRLKAERTLTTTAGNDPREQAPTPGSGRRGARPPLDAIRNLLNPKGHK